MNDTAPLPAPEPSKASRHPRLVLSRAIASPTLVVATAALLLSAAVSAGVIWIQHEYLARAAVAYDSVYYQFYNARLFLRLAHESTLDVVLGELRSNWRHPLRTILTVLLAPGLLTSPVGHMATAAPALLAFLFLLGNFVYRRTRSLIYAVAALVMFCGVRGLYHATIGFGSFWLEPPAALLVGAAVLCLLCSDEGQDLRWLAAFGVFASLATLSRYVAAVYVFVVAGPILGLYLGLRAFRERELVRAVLVPGLVVGGVIAALAGPFLVGQYGPNMSYYSSRGYALFNDLSASLQFLTSEVGLLRLAGPALLLGLACSCVAYCVVERAALLSRRLELVVSLWVMVAVPLYSVAVLRVVGATHSLWYAVPMLCIGLLAPFSTRAPGSRRVALTCLAAAMLLLGGVLSIQDTSRVLALARNPAPDVVVRKQFVLNLGRALAASGDRVVWSPFFDEYSHIPAVEALYDGRGLPLPAGPSYFSIHTAYWHTDFPGLAPDEVARRVYAATDRYVDLVVVFKNPEAALTAPWLNNDYSRTVARYVARQIVADPSWSYVQALEGSPYGELVLYRNSARGAYEAFLVDDEGVRP